MNIVLYDDRTWEKMLPLTYTRTVAELRVGILTIKEKWQQRIEGEYSYLTQPYLRQKFPLNTGSDNIVINSSLLPNDDLVAAVKNLKANSLLKFNDLFIAAHAPADKVEHLAEGKLDHFKIIEYSGELLKVDYPWDLFKINGEELKKDYGLLTKNRTSQKISTTNRVLGSENIFIENGAKVEFAIINATTGPVYIDSDAEVMEGSIIRGPFYLGKHSVLKLGAKIYGPTTVGPYCKVGGEVNNSILTGYSNKGHDGFLGNSVLGEWCNIGADTNNSNLKNNYADVRMWSYASEKFDRTGLQFAGLIMGDHSKSGINTMFNTGTVVGVSANIFGSGFPRNFIPSFSWGGASGFSVYALNKAVQTAEKVYERRNIEFDSIEKDILKNIFDISEKYRR